MKKKNKNIIYLCSSEKGPSGGAKIIHDHSQIINNSNTQFKSQIVHIAKKKSSKWKKSVSKFLNTKPSNFSGWQFEDIIIKKKFNYSWFKHKISSKDNFLFSKNDFVFSIYTKAMFF